MGKQVQKKAIQLGLTNQPKYTFYVQPRKVKGKFSRVKPDFAYIIENWMNDIDSSNSMSEIARGRSYSFYYMAPELNIYVELVDKIGGGIAYNEANHAIKIDIYTNNEDYVRALVKGINGIWDDGIVPHLNIPKLEKKFKVKGEDIINALNSFL